MKKQDIRIAIVGSDFQKFVTDNLEKNCIETLLRNGMARDCITVVRVPGSLEIPLAALLLAKKKKFDAIIAFGAIHKGKTYHFQQVADECIRGCMNVSHEYQIPVIYEVLAVYDMKDARERRKAMFFQRVRYLRAKRTAHNRDADILFLHTLLFI